MHMLQAYGRCSILLIICFMITSQCGEMKGCWDREMHTFATNFSITSFRSTFMNTRREQETKAKNMHITSHKFLLFSRWWTNRSKNCFIGFILAYKHTHTPTHPYSTEIHQNCIHLFFTCFDMCVGCSRPFYSTIEALKSFFSAFHFLRALNLISVLTDRYKWDQRKMVKNENKRQNKKHTHIRTE